MMKLNPYSVYECDKVFEPCCLLSKLIIVENTLQLDENVPFDRALENIGVEHKNLKSQNRFSFRDGKRAREKIEK